MTDTKFIFYLDSAKEIMEEAYDCEYISSRKRKFFPDESNENDYNYYYYYYKGKT